MGSAGVSPVALVGLHGGEWFGAEAGRVLRNATVVFGNPRHLAALPADVCGRRVELRGGIDGLLVEIEACQVAGESVCVVASGDPGFFGLARVAGARFGPGAVRVYPAPSSVALAFGRAGLSWDDGVVVSAHGRPLEPAVEAVLAGPKVAVLCSPDHPPQAVGSRLVEGGCGPRRVTVASRLGEADESVWSGDLGGLAAGRFDPLSVVLLVAGEGGTGAAGGAGGVGWAGWRWGLPDATFAHRGGMITKAEVRAVALGKLGVPEAGVMWDVGSGSGSVAAECARLAPGLRVFAVERRPDDVERMRANLAGTAVTVVRGEAPAALAALPDPDRVFVGGGGLSVLDAVLERLRPGGTAVATYAALDRAAAGAARLGHVVQVSVSRGVPVGEDGALRLAADNPVFVCWGPGE